MRSLRHRYFERHEMLQDFALFVRLHLKQQFPCVGRFELSTIRRHSRQARLNPIDLVVFFVHCHNQPIILYLSVFNHHADSTETSGAPHSAGRIPTYRTCHPFPLSWTKELHFTHYPEFSIQYNQAQKHRKLPATPHTRRNHSEPSHTLPCTPPKSR